MNRLPKFIGLFESHLSAAEWAWRIVTVLVVAGGGTSTGFLASSSEFLKPLGPIVWVSIALLSGLVLTWIFYLVKAVQLKDAEAGFVRAVSIQDRSTNPLLDSYKDQLIKIEDLRLPGKQLHKNKLFKRCKFVGPGAVAILGGTYHDDGFIECGDMVVLPKDVLLTGIIVLDNCTVESCEFHRITVFMNEQMAKEMQKMGAQIAGLHAA